jgi:hypothetical protein
VIYIFTKTAFRHGVSRKSAIFIIENYPGKILDITKERREKIGWIAEDSKDEKLEIIAIHHESYWEVFHAMPRIYKERRGKLDEEDLW